VSAIRALLTGAIDYAGLFPPAGLPMADAVRNYATYRASPDAWALGRFVVPIARLDEFRDATASARDTREPWRLSVLAGASGADDWKLAGAANLGPALIESVELRACVPEEVRRASARLPREVDVFYEIPLDGDVSALVRAIGAEGAKAKVRTGGVTAEAFPAARDLARFVVTCARAHVAFKATAGLHHPLRATYRLTYEADSPTGVMFGFLNVLLAAGFAQAGRGEDVIRAVLEEDDASALRFDSAGVSWRGQHLAIEDIARGRATLALSFGSCSFREPIDELKGMGIV